MRRKQTMPDFVAVHCILCCEGSPVVSSRRNAASCSEDGWFLHCLTQDNHAPTQ